VKCPQGGTGRSRLLPGAGLIATELNLVSNLGIGGRCAQCSQLRDINGAESRIRIHCTFRIQASERARLASLRRLESRDGESC
jgi:hypothetical protein